MSLYKEFVRDNIMVLGGNILIYARGIILLPLVIKFFGVSSYGVYSLFVSYVSIAYGISSLGVGFQYQRSMPSAATTLERRQLFYPQLLFRTGVLALLGVGFLFAHKDIDTLLLKTDEEYSQFAVIAMLASMLLFAQTTDYFRYTGRMKYFTLGTVANPYLLIVSVVLGVLLFDQTSLDYLLYSNSIAMLVACAPLTFIVMREIRFRASFYKLPQLIDDIKLGFPITLSVFLDFLMAGSDRFVIAYFLSATAVGFYAPVYTIAFFVVLIPKVLGVVLPPLLSRAVDSGQHNAANILVNKGTKMFLFFIIPYVVAMGVLAKPILALLANDEIASSVSHLVPIIGVGVIFYGLNIIFSHGVAFIKLQTKWILYSNAVAGFLSVSLNIVFMSLFNDLLVPAVVTSASFLVSYILLWNRIHRLINIRFDCQFIMKVFSASVIMAVMITAISMMDFDNLTTVAVSLPVALAAYAASIYAFKAVGDSEIKYIQKYLREFGGPSTQ